MNTKEEMRHRIQQAEARLHEATRSLRYEEMVYCRLYSPYKKGDRVLVDGKHHAIVSSVRYSPNSWDSIGDFSITLHMTNKNWQPCEPFREKKIYKDSQLEIVKEEA